MITMFICTAVSFVACFIIFISMREKLDIVKKSEAVAKEENEVLWENIKELYKELIKYKKCEQCTSKGSPECDLECCVDELFKED